MPPPIDFQGIVRVTNSSDQATITMWGGNGHILAGGPGIMGLVEVAQPSGQRMQVRPGFVMGKSANGDTACLLQAAPSRLHLMENGGGRTVELSGSKGTLTLGDHGKGGDVYLLDANGEKRVRMNGWESKVQLYDETGRAIAVLGPEGSKSHGTLRLYNEHNKPIAILGRDGNLTLGGGAGSGRRETGADGDIKVLDSQGRTRFHVDGDAGDLFVRNASGQDTIKLDGDQGDIVLFNADCAEEFETADDGAEAGSVMVAEKGPTLVRTERAYDRRVVGVVSGAGGFRPGMVLGHREDGRRRVPVAVLGRVGCLVDAAHGPIEIGDLLTTSTTKGHAMRATDPAAAMGAVLGKALSPLSEGRGLVETLVTLR